MHKRHLTYAALLLVALLLPLASCQEETVSHGSSKLNHDWLFALTDTAFAYEQDFDDSQWQHVNLPHDWSIHGDYCERNPSGIATGALPGGIGWYRKYIEVTDEDLYGRIILRFDGVYRDATVFVNGIKEGRRPNGFASVSYDITPDLHPGTNSIAVKVDNSLQPNVTHYTGSGIYRNVWITKSGPIHIAPSGVCIRTPLVNETKANVEVITTVSNQNDFDADVDIQTVIRDYHGRTVAHDVSTVHAEAEGSIPLTQQMRIASPALWDVDNPRLYTAEITLSVRGRVTDHTTTTFGIRSFYFDAETGFTLNDRHLSIQGVCLLPDLGSLGTASNTQAIAHRLNLLKEMGCNAVRAAYAPPAPELLDLCDSLGLLVIIDAFDVWHISKTAHDYANYFDEWHERDLTDLVLLHRNHPSLIAWSLGNNLPEFDATQSPDSVSNKPVNRQSSARIAAHLTDIVHRLDPTRPVTAGTSNTSPSNPLFQTTSLDIISFAYSNLAYDSVPLLFRDKPFLILESGAALMSRGYYRMPSTKTLILPEDTKTKKKSKTAVDIKFTLPLCSSYDNCHTPYGSSHELTLIQVRDNPFIAGQFVWSGFDYIGDPVPFGWPARSSYFGIIDIAGFPKDVYYLYQSEWQTDKTVLHLFPHWNWTIGDNVDLWCYYNNADEVELYINGRSQGIRTKNKHSLHAMWQVQYDPGECRVVSRKDGKVVAEEVITTAGRPVALRLTPDRKKIHANGDDLCYVTVEVVDSKGNLCPSAQNDVTFTVEGAGFLETVDNGSSFSLAPFKSDHIRAFYGKALALVRSSGTAGNVLIKASSPSLSSASLTIHCLDDHTY